MYEQMSFEDLPNVIFSRESAGGRSRSKWQAFKKISPAGLARVRAKVSATPEKRKEPQTNATCGLYSLNSSKHADLNLSLANRLKRRFGTDGSIEYAQTWKQKTTPSGLSYLAHTASERRTGDIDCIGEVIAWPTANARDVKGQSGTGRQERKNHPTDTLANAAVMAAWPTATVNDQTGSQYQRCPGGTIALKLPGAANTVLTATNGIPKHHGSGLMGNVQIAAWQTVTVNDSKNNASPSQWCRTSNGKPRKLALNCEVFQVFLPGQAPDSSTAGTIKSGGFRLNPFFSAWLMGFPKIWTQCGIRAYLNTPKGRSRSARKTQSPVGQCS